MADLITDLQNATTGTRELDARLWCEMENAKGSALYRLPNERDLGFFQKPALGLYVEVTPRGKSVRPAPRLTTAPEGLRILMDYVRERWPLATCYIHWDRKREKWMVALETGHYDWEWIDIHHPTDPAIALAIAILKAMESTND